MDRRQFLESALVTSGLVLSGLPQATAAAVESKIPWYKDLREAHTKAIELDRPILVVSSATWCTYCHKLIREAAADTKTSKLISARFVPTLLDFDKDTRIAKVFDVESLPTTVVLSPNADLLLNKMGYMKPEAFRKVLDEALDRQAEIRQVNARSAGR